MPDLLTDTPADQTAREAALDIRHSVIVQAPAGSGKTDLLTRRYLRLLAAVDEPEEILAITFTVAATAEMRGRILADLEACRRSFPPERLQRMLLAREALDHAERRGWNLLEHPERLAIETIDSLCLRIAHDRPLLAHLGGKLQPTEQAEPLYALAARRTLDHLGGLDAHLNRALAHLLDLRDNRLSGCEQLLANMLAVRDQWQHAFPLFGDMSEEDWADARVKLEMPFQQEHRRVLSDAHRLLSREASLSEQLFELANYALAEGNDKLRLLAGLRGLSPAMHLEHWKCLCDFLLKADNEWLRTVDRRHGFPPGTPGSEAKQRKDAMIFVLGRLRQMPRLLEALCAIRSLPPVSYSDQQWMTLRHILTVLRRAIAELKVVFAEKNSVDFTEISLAALQVLRQTPERIGAGLRHLLIDEFQDTSRRQHELVTALLAAWDPGEERTVFLVGDPMQSIYMFRQAEVELFAHVRQHGLALPADPAVPSAEAQCIRCEPVQLTVNFRSHAGLTEPLNEIFTAVCADASPPGSAAVPFAEAVASAPALHGRAIHIHPELIGSPEQAPTQADFRAAQEREAEQVLRILEERLPLIEAVRAGNREYRVAILVRSRTHLSQIVPLLRRHRIALRAVEIERLADRQELLDLRSLTRALLHPMDRIAWLSVLRAPWCGLTIADLHRLTGADDPRWKNASVLELIEQHQPLLSADGQQRLTRTMEILRRALDLRWRLAESPSFASWIERTWQTLGGPACLDAAALENAEVFFSLLDAIAPDGLAASTGELDAEFERLFAQPDPAGSIEVMTIHKAKGLGFDVVLVPGLDRQSASDPHPLISSLERISPWRAGETEFLVAPIGEQGEETHPLYKWVERQRKIRFDEERKRLFYVACTRARSELHLLGTAVVTNNGVRAANRDSLLATAWPALEEHFERLLHQPQSPSRALDFPAPGILDQVAAAAGGLTLRRLPADYEQPFAANIAAASSISLSQTQEFLRPEGSRQARIIGSAVHTLLQRFGAGLAGTPTAKIRSQAASLLRAAALTGDALSSATAAVTNMLATCAADPVCQWILAPHADAQSEVSWTGYARGERSQLRTLRADRVFRAGAEPLSVGSDYFWVIDYKTSGAPSGALFLSTERAVYAPQLEAYGQALRALHGEHLQLRLGLYYPALAALDFWDPDRV